MAVLSEESANLTVKEFLFVKNPISDASIIASILEKVDDSKPKINNDQRSKAPL